MLLAISLKIVDRHPRGRASDSRPGSAARLTPPTDLAAHPGGGVGGADPGGEMSHPGALSRPRGKAEEQDARRSAISHGAYARSPADAVVPDRRVGASRGDAGTRGDSTGTRRRMGIVNDVRSDLGDAPGDM